MRILTSLWMLVAATFLSNCKNNSEVVPGARPSQIESIERIIINKATGDTLKTMFDFAFDDQNRVTKMVGRDFTDIQTFYELTYDKVGQLERIDLFEKDSEILGTQRSEYQYKNGRMEEERMLFVDGTETEPYATRTYLYNECCPNQLKSVTTQFDGMETPYSIVEFSYGLDSSNPEKIKYFHVASGDFTEYDLTTLMTSQMCCCLTISALKLKEIFFTWFHARFQPILSDSPMGDCYIINILLNIQMNSLMLMARKK